MNRFIGPILILLCTVIWGTAFLAQKLGADHYGPFTITCYRNVLGGLFLSLVVAIRDRGLVSGWTCKVTLGGALSGVCLFGAMSAQQIGIEYTTPGISAFLTANYVLLVPIFAWLLGKGRAKWPIWIGVGMAISGTYLICIQSHLSSIGKGEFWTLLCAALFAIQIMVVDHYANDVDVIRFSMIQLFVAALCALPFVFLPCEMARTDWSNFVSGLPALLFVGILSSGIAYTMQNLGQARTPPTLAAIIMSMESVFGALSGWMFLNDTMSTRQFAGCVLVFLAVMVSQLAPLRNEG